MNAYLKSVQLAISKRKLNSSSLINRGGSCGGCVHPTWCGHDRRLSHIDRGASVL